MFSTPPKVSHRGLNLPFPLIYFVSECFYGHDKDIRTVKSNKEEFNFICNQLTTRLRANEWKQDNRSQSFSPGLHLLELGLPAVSLRPPSLSRLCNPLKHPSFLAVISFPMLSASACTLFLFVCHPNLLSVSPPALPQLLFGELFISLYVINQHLFKRYDWGAVEDGRGDIDWLWWRTWWGGNWGMKNGGEKRKRKQNMREHDDWDQQTGRKKWRRGGEEKRVKEWGKNEMKTVVMRWKKNVGLLQKEKSLKTDQGARC